MYLVYTLLPWMNSCIPIPEEPSDCPIAATKENMFGLATKSDQAEVLVFIWNDRIWEMGIHSTQAMSLFSIAYPNCCPLDFMRSFLLCCWRRQVSHSLLRYLREEHGPDWHLNPAATRDRDVRMSCISHATKADWWEWWGGSTLLFWRWPPEVRAMAQDGHAIWVKGSLPAYHRPQCPKLDPVLQAQVLKKLENVWDKGYITKMTAQSLTSFFVVPKGPEDIRIVYDTTKSGLNSALWVPSFSLPTVENLTNLLGPSLWMGDLDMGEMFLKFPLDTTIQLYCGIDLCPYFDPENVRRSTWWEGWGRCMMGLGPSPYVCTKSIL